MADTVRKLNIWINDKQVEASMKSISAAIAHSRNQLAKMEIGSKDYIEQTKKIQQLRSVMDQHIQYQKRIETGWKSVKSSVGQIAVGNFLANAMGNITSAIGGMFRSAFEKIKEFSSAISELEAITGLEGDDLETLKNRAKDFAAQYGRSASEIVEAMKMVGSAKPEVLSNADALSQVTEAVLTLSQATGMELSETTSSLTTIMNQFGHGAELAAEDINILAAGSKYGAVEVDYLAESISKVGTIAAAAGLDLEQTTAVMELFGEKGVKAETAGRGFKTILTELQKDTKNYTNGVFDLNKAIDNNQNIAGDNLKLQEKFGTEFFGLAQIMFKNKERFQELNKQVAGTNTAFEQAAINMDNLSGDLAKANGAWDRFILSVEDGDGVISKATRAIVQSFSELFEGLEKVNDTSAKTSDRIKGFIDVISKSNPAFNIINRNIESLWNKFLDLNPAIRKSIDWMKEFFGSSENQKVSSNKIGIFDGAQMAKQANNLEENVRKQAEMQRLAKEQLAKEQLEIDEKLAEESRKKAEDAHKKALAELEKFKNEAAKIDREILNQQRQINSESLGEEEKQIQEIIFKYEDQLNVVDGFIAELRKKQETKEGLNDDELKLLETFLQQRTMLVELGESEIAAVVEKGEEKIRQQLGKTSEEFGKAAGEMLQGFQLNPDKAVDIFGMTQEDWDKVTKNFEKVMTYASMARGAIGEFFNYQSVKAQAEISEYEDITNRKKQALDKQLQQGLISQENYNAQIQSIEKKLADKKKKAAAEESKRNKALRRFDTVMNTASAVMNALTVRPFVPLGLAMAAFAATTGAMQLATISKEPIPKFAKGGRVNSPTIAEIGEAGPEIVLSNRIVSSPTLGPIADDLARIQEGKQARFLGNPRVPNFGGMSSAIGGGINSSVVNNTVINQVDNRSIDNMNAQIEQMSKDIGKMTSSVEKLKYLQAVISTDQITEYEEDERIRKRYSGI